MIDIQGFEGLYKINELGEVYSIGYGHIRKLTPYIDGNGYPILDLRKNGKRYCSLLHRLIAIHFIPNPDLLPIVLHLDNDPMNYSITNLRWGTRNDNSSQMSREGRGNFNKNHPRIKRFGKDNPKSKIVFQFSLDGNLIAQWDSLNDASRALGVGKISLKQKTAYGFIWRCSETPSK